MIFFEKFAIRGRETQRNAREEVFVITQISINAEIAKRSEKNNNKCENKILAIKMNPQ